MNSDFSIRFKQLREALGLSQAEVALVLGVHLQTISRYERGELNPSARKISVLADSLGINPDWLLTGKGWSYIPSTSAQAFEWIKKQIERGNVLKVLIVTYMDNKAGWANGFILETKKGVLSMEGGSTHCGYSGRGTTSYVEILLFLKEKGIPTTCLPYNPYENTLSLNQIDMSSLLSHPLIRQNVIDDELKAWSEGPAAHSKDKRKDVSWTIPVIVKITDISGLSEEEAKREITIMETLYNTAYSPKRVQIFIGKPD